MNTEDLAVVSEAAMAQLRSPSKVQMVPVSVALSLMTLVSTISARSQRKTTMIKEMEEKIEDQKKEIREMERKNPDPCPVSAPALIKERLVYLKFSDSDSDVFYNFTKGVNVNGIMKEGCNDIDDHIIVFNGLVHGHALINNALYNEKLLRSVIGNSDRFSDLGRYIASFSSVEFVAILRIRFNAQTPFQIKLCFYSFTGETCSCLNLQAVYNELNKMALHAGIGAEDVYSKFKSIMPEWHLFKERENIMKDIMEAYRKNFDWKKHAEKKFCKPEIVRGPICRGCKKRGHYKRECPSACE